MSVETFDECYAACEPDNDADIVSEFQTIYLEVTPEERRGVTVKFEQLVLASSEEDKLEKKNKNVPNFGGKSVAERRAALAEKLTEKKEDNGEPSMIHRLSDKDLDEEEDDAISGKSQSDASELETRDIDNSVGTDLGTNVSEVLKAEETPEVPPRKSIYPADKNCWLPPLLREGESVKIITCGTVVPRSEDEESPNPENTAQGSLRREESNSQEEQLENAEDLSESAPEESDSSFSCYLPPTGKDLRWCGTKVPEYEAVAEDEPKSEETTKVPLEEQIESAGSEDSSSNSKNVPETDNSFFCNLPPTGKPLRWCGTNVPEHEAAGTHEPKSEETTKEPIEDQNVSTAEPEDSSSNSENVPETDSSFSCNLPPTGKPLRWCGTKVPEHEASGTDEPKPGREEIAKVPNKESETIENPENGSQDSDSSSETASTDVKDKMNKMATVYQSIETEEDPSEEEDKKNDGLSFYKSIDSSYDPVSLPLGETAQISFSEEPDDLEVLPNKPVINPMQPSAASKRATFSNKSNSKLTTLDADSVYYSVQEEDSKTVSILPPTRARKSSRLSLPASLQPSLEEITRSPAPRLSQTKKLESFLPVPKNSDPILDDPEPVSLPFLPSTFTFRPTKLDINKRSLSVTSPDVHVVVTDKLISPMADTGYESVYRHRLERGISFGSLPTTALTMDERPAAPIKDISHHLEITHQSEPPVTEEKTFPKSPDNFDLEVSSKLTQPAPEELSLDLPEIVDASKRITKSKSKKKKGKSKIPQRQDSKESKESSVGVVEEKVVQEAVHDVQWEFDDQPKDEAFLKEERLREAGYDTANGKCKESGGESGSESDSRGSPRKHAVLSSPGKRTIASSSGSDVALHEGAELSPDDNTDVVGSDGLRQSMQNILDQFMNEERRFDNQ